MLIVVHLWEMKQADGAAHYRHLQKTHHLLLVHKMSTLPHPSVYVVQTQ